MRKNYQAWVVNIEDFYQAKDSQERLMFLLKFAVLAPSSHNSQPWKFEISGNIISIFLEKSRRLRQSDENDRQAYISLGCALENILIAAHYYGYLTKVVYLPNPANPSLAVEIYFSRKEEPKQDDNHLIFSIPKRVTNRNPYADTMPSADFLEQIQGFSSGDMRVTVVTDQNLKSAITDTALNASIAAMEDKDFRLELSRYVKSNITSSSIGMPCFGMGIPTLFSFIVPTIIRYLNVNKINNKKDKKLLKEQTSSLVILETQNDDKLSWLKTGQIYEKIALMATASRLATAMWAAPIQIGEFYKDIQKILKSFLRPQVLFRLGYPLEQTKHSPRLFSNNLLSL